jgi:hypothetical protein
LFVSVAALLLSAASLFSSSGIGGSTPTGNAGAETQGNDLFQTPQNLEDLVIEARKATVTIYCDRSPLGRLRDISGSPLRH